LLGLASLGQTGVVLLGGLDLSIPGFITAGAFMTGKLAGEEHWPVVGVALVAIVAAGTIGAATGWLCHRLRLQPLIMTLATSSMVAGGAIVWTKAQVTGSPPAWLSRLTSPTGTTFGLGVPPVVVIWAVVAVLVGVVLSRTVSGRQVYATGANLRAAQLALVRTGRVWAAVFAVSAISSVIVGILLAGFAGAGDPTVGDPYLFQGITAIIVGGTTIGGARGDYWHTVVGALVMTELVTILVGHGLSGADQQIVFGLLILIVVAAYGRDRRVRDRV
jgi:ribose transport system permease protein